MKNLKEYLPDLKSKIKSNKINDDLDIFRDEYGIPHIYAKNEYDAFFGQGFATAQDRLWHMEYDRKRAYGKLSEIIGNNGLDNDKFMGALNILEQNNHQSLLKQFLQSFKPGDNRFTDLEIKLSPSNQPLLNEALAWLEGTVNQRMECGDHWLIYAEIKHGKVIKKDGVTAVHHRKTGANY